MSLSLLEVAFVAAVLIAGYTYVGYPLAILALSRIIPRRVWRAEILPSVSVVITVHDEERVIAEKIENALALDYPRERLEIIVASDCSTDGTDAVARSYASRGVTLRRLPRRGGKTAAQQFGAAAAAGDVLLLSDASSMLRPDAVRKIVRNFADPSVGCVAGRLVYSEVMATEVSRGCLVYGAVEDFLKKCESRLGSLVGASGSLYAVRRTSFTRLPPDIIDDFARPLQVRLEGLRTVYEPEAIGVKSANYSASSEFRMRVRVIEGTYRALEQYRELLDVRRHGLFAVQLLSHKVLRHAMPVVLAVALVSNALLAASDTLYAAAFCAQLAPYAAALAGAAAERLGLGARLLALPYSFALANTASLVALVRFASGNVRVTWARARDFG
jgi:cellulose synthase/poly-beta-1,6-N-acetylglucosamine synthase-like glycosyltransferase